MAMDAGAQGYLLKDDAVDLVLPADGQTGRYTLVVQLDDYWRWTLGQVDIEKMAMYFAAQAPQLREPPPFGDPQRGEAESADCGSCHGSRGVSHDPMVPNLAGQEPTYLVNAIKAYRDHERSHEEMVADISDEEPMTKGSTRNRARLNRPSARCRCVWKRTVRG